MAESKELILEAKRICAHRLNSYIESHKTSCGTRPQWAKHFAVGKNTINSWLFERELITCKMADKLQKFVHFTDAELQIIAKANAAQNSLKEFGGIAKKSQEKIRPKTPNGLEERVGALEKKVFESETPPKTLPEKCVKDIMSGKTAEKPTAGSMRFIITKKNFMVIDSGEWSEKEISDTKKLIEELRRRLNLLAQHPNETIRIEHLQMLGKELDELFRSYQQARCIIPFQILDIIDRERQGALLPENRQGS